MTQDVKKIVKILGMLVFFAILLGYAFSRSYDLISGVKIKNVNIESGMKIESSPLKITGNARNANKITLNDRIVSIDQKGNFSETIALFPGYNVISIKAEDKFGNKDEKDYQLIY